ncbi:MAG: thrombospondin type 3 repeat-containing protein [Fibrobacterales bacterium]
MNAAKTKHSNSFNYTCSLDDSERVISQPYFFIEGGFKYLFFFTYDGSNKYVRLYNATTPGSLLPVLSKEALGNGPHIVIDTHLYIFDTDHISAYTLADLASGALNATTVTGYTYLSQAPNFFKYYENGQLADKFQMSYPNGKIEIFTFSDAFTLDGKKTYGVDLGVRSIKSRPEYIVEKSSSNSYFVSIDNLGDIITTSADVQDEIWLTEPYNSTSFDAIDVYPVGVDNEVIQILSKDNKLYNYNISSNKIIGQEHTFLIAPQVVKNITGNTINSSTIEYSSPSTAFASYTFGGFNRLWGYFHHDGSFSLSQFKVTPEKYSPTLNGPLITSFPASGNINVTYDLLIKDAVGTIVKTWPKAPLAYGQNTIDWDGIDDNGVAAVSNNYIMSALFTIPGGTTEQVDKNFILDRDPVTDVSLDLMKGIPDIEVTSPQLGLTINNNRVFVSSIHKINLDFSNVIDVAPFTQSDLSVELTLQDINQPVKSYTYRWDKTTLNPVTHSLTLNGKTQGGVNIPDGIYDLSYKVIDQAGNESTLHSGFKLENDPNLYEGIYILQNDVSISARVNPFFITASDAYTAKVDITLTAPQDKVYTLNMYLIDAQGNQQSLPGFVAQQITLSSGSATYAQTFDFSSITQTGMNQIVIEVLNETFNKQAKSIPLIRDRIEATIISPENNETISHRLVEISGVATAPTFGTKNSNSITFYKAYYSEGAHTLSSSITEKYKLFENIAWKALPVPLSQQIRSTDPVYKQIKREIDAEFPNSNISAVDVSTNGVLALFEKNEILNQEQFTVLIISSELFSNKLDSDGDNIPDAVDNCPYLINSEQFDLTNDGIGDKCQSPVNNLLDSDGDGKLDIEDLCVYLSTDVKKDDDNSGRGDQCEFMNLPDDDGDGVENSIDNCVYLPNEPQMDNNKDGIGDLCQTNSEIFSYDSKVFNYGPFEKINAELILMATQVSKNVDQMSPIIVNLDPSHIDAEPEFTQLSLTADIIGFTTDIDMTVVKGHVSDDKNGGESHEVVFVHPKVTNSTGPASLLFLGKDYTDRTVDEGNYTAIIEAKSSEIGLMRHYYHFSVSIPEPPTNDDTQLLVEPGRIPLDYTEGSKPRIDIEFDINKKSDVKIKIFHSADLVNPIRKYSFTNSRTEQLSWDFLTEQGVYIVDQLNTDSPLVNEKTFVVQLVKGTDVLATQNVVIEEAIPEITYAPSILEYTPNAAGVWEAGIHSGYKFKALAKGDLQFIPNKNLKPGMEVSANQKVRVFPEVPYRMTYSKYYNTASIFANYEITAEGRHAGYGVCCSGSWTSELAKDSEKNLIKTIDGSGRFASTNDVTPQFSKDPSYVAGESSPIWYGDIEPWFDQSQLSSYDKWSECLEFHQEAFVMNKNSLSINELLFQARVMGQDGEGDDAFKERKGSLQLGVNFGKLNAGCGLDLAQGYPIPRLENEMKTWGAVGYGPFWMVRSNNWSTDTYHSHKFNYSNWDRDAGDPPRNHAFYPMKYVNDSIDFTHPTLYKRDLIIDEPISYQNYLNYLDGVAGNDETLLPTIPDDYPWDDGISLGMRFGMRGFAYTHKDDTYLNGGSGNDGFTHLLPVIYPKDFIENYYVIDRPDKGETLINKIGHMYWSNEQFSTNNRDNIGIFPILKIDLSTKGYTWDDIEVGYPIGDGTGLNIERRNNEPVVVTYRNVYEESEIVGNDIVMSVPTNFQSTGDAADDEILCFPINQWISGTEGLFEELLRNVKSRSDVVPPDEYPYVLKETLQFSAIRPLSTYINYDQTIETLDPNDFALHFNEDIFYNFTQSEINNSGCPNPSQYSLDDVVYKLTNRNAPMTANYWSSKDDPAFAVYDGYLYGSGKFNEHGFKTQQNAMSENGNGYRGLVQELISNVNVNLAIPTEQGPQIVSPFVNNNGAVEFNSNILPSSLEWVIDVYHHDGEQLNDALEVKNQNEEEMFNLGLALDITPKNFVEIRGAIPNAIPVAESGLSNDIHFKSYQLFAYVPVKEKNEAEENYSEAEYRYEQISVNKYFRSDLALDKFEGDILPQRTLDLWDNSETGSVNPVLGYWDVTHLNGLYDIVLRITYVDNNSGSTYLVKKPIKIQVGTELVAGLEPVVQSTYKRAELNMPDGSFTSGDVLSMYPVSYKDLSLGDDLPDVKPIGPVIEIKTTGSTKKFEGTSKPVITYQYSAREIFQMNGRLADFELYKSTSDISALRTELLTFISTYNVYMLNEEGQLDEMPTIGTLSSHDLPSEIEELSVLLTAPVSHFSWAVVLESSTLPTLTHAIIEGTDVIVKGTYGTPIVGTIPTDLELYIHKFNSRSESPTYIRGIWSPVINKTGTFELRIPISEFYPGDNYIYASYAVPAPQVAQNSAKIKVEIETAQLLVEDIKAYPSVFEPHCEKNNYSLSFAASKSGIATRYILDNFDNVVSKEVVAIDYGINRFKWDGCVEQSTLNYGEYLVKYIFEGAGSQNFVMGLKLTASDQIKSVKSINVKYSRFLPSVTNSRHLQHFKIYTHGIDAASDLTINLSRESDATSWTLTPELWETKNNEFVYRATWNGLNGNTIEVDDTYKVTVSHSTQGVVTPLKKEFELYSSIPPSVAVTHNFGSGDVPSTVPAIEVLLTNSVKMGVVLWLEYLNGDIFSTELGKKGTATTSDRYDVVNSGSKRYTVKMKNSEFPTRIFAQWETEEGESGLVSSTISVNYNPVLTGINHGSLEIQPQVSDVFRSHFENRGRFTAYSRSTYVEFTSSRAGEVRYVVERNGQVYRNDNLAIRRGPNKLFWDGKDDQGNYVPKSGIYTIKVFTQPSDPSGTEQLVSSCTYSVDVYIVPDIAICKSSDPIYTQNKITDPNRFVTGLITKLSQPLVGITNVMELSPEETVGYMQYNPNGMVVIVNDITPKEIFDGTRDNPLFSYIRSGGNAVFINSFPFAHYVDQFGNIQSSLELSLLLLGENEQQGLTALQDRMNALYALSEGVTQFDGAQVDDLSAVVTSGILNAGLIGTGVPQSYLVENGGLFSPQLFTDQQTLPNGALETFIHSGYFKPKFKATELHKSGAFLIMHPFGFVMDNSTAGIQKEQEVTEDVANSVYRNFFANDLYILSRDVKITHNDDKILHSESIDISVTINYKGKHTIPSVEVVLTDLNNSNWTQTLNYSNISMGSSESERTQTITVPIDALASFDRHIVTVDITPFSINVPPLVINEEVVYNNQTQAVYYVQSNIAPTLTINNITSGYFDGLITGLATGLPYEVSGSIVNSHGQGDIKLTTILKDNADNGIKFYSSTLVTTPNFTQEVSPTVDLDPTHNYSVSISAKDKYDNQTDVEYLINIDGELPVITQLTCDNSHVTKIFGTEAVHYVIDDIARFTFEVSDNLGLKSYTLKRGPAVLVDEVLSGVTSGIQTFTFPTTEGDFTFITTDNAGNEMKRNFTIVNDVEKSVVRILNVGNTLMHQVVDGTITISEDAFMYDEPLFEHFPLVVRGTDEENEFIETARNDFATIGVNVDELPGFKIGDYSTHFMHTTTKAMFLIDIFEEHLNSVKVKINDDPAVDASTLDPFQSLLPASMLPMYTNHKYHRYIEFDGLIVGEEYNIKVMVEDESGNVTTIDLKLGNAINKSYVEDPQGDRSSAIGPDFGEVYVSTAEHTGFGSQEGGAWVYFMIYSYNSDFANQITDNYLYIDADKLEVTGAQDVGRNSQNFDGFEYRVTFGSVDVLDSGKATNVTLEEWNGTAWAALRATTEWNVNASIQIDANQINDVWTPPRGEGHQVTPSDKIAKAPGSVIEIGVRLNNMYAKNDIRWFLDGEYDDVYNTNTTQPFLFKYITDGSKYIDGITKDWYTDTPFNALRSDILVSAKPSEKDIPIQNTWEEQKISFSILNNGFTDVGNVSLRYFINLGGCTDVRTYLDNVNETFWKITTDAPIQANTLGRYKGLDDDIYFVELEFITRVLTPGAELKGIPYFTLKGNGCTTRFEDNFNNQLPNNVELVNEHNRSLLNSQITE